MKKETGFDLNEATMKVDELVDRVKDGVKKCDDELTRFRTELLPQFVEWNRWERWKVMLLSTYLESLSTYLESLLSKFSIGC